MNSCTLALNQAASEGGGAYQCSLSNCTLEGNAAFCGGGASRAVLNDCTLSDNSATNCGGGAAHGTLTNCLLTGNAAATNYGGGAFVCALYDCVLVSNSAFIGGGSASGVLNRCTLSGNSAGDGGGGSAYDTASQCLLTSNSALSGGGSFRGGLSNCKFVGNHASGAGGGAFLSILTNCTVTGNSASSQAGGVLGGGVVAPVRNGIVYFNTAPADANWLNTEFYYSCTIPAPSDPWSTGNITDDPRFMNAAAGNYHLQSDSPCINRGNNSYGIGPVDLDGKPRLVGGTVDMGAYEYQGYWGWASAITNELTNYNDCATGDGYPNLVKYVTGSSATNSDALARLSGYVSNGMGVLVFNRDTAVDDATLIVQGSVSISNDSLWVGLATNINGSWGGTPNVIELGAGNPVVCHVQDPSPSPTNRFLRLAVTRP
ncbi:MAG: hypothetical protein KA248_07335 [Kiritimatiellae bacterium]|nr:hypothetical protein [Kiritimatiellia bacterium]